VPRLVLTFFAAACLAFGSAVAAEGVFTGIHSKEGVNGRPNTVRITDGKTFLDITEQEYRERGYIPTFEKLPMLIVRRLSPRIPVPQEQDK
jgi:hypothetical protein